MGNHGRFGKTAYFARWMTSRPPNKAPVLAFTGLWDRWTDPASGDDVLLATIIVSGVSAWMEPYGGSMPVLLDGTLGPEALKLAAESGKPVRWDRFSKVMDRFRTLEGGILLIEDHDDVRAPTPHGAGGERMERQRGRQWS